MNDYKLKVPTHQIFNGLAAGNIGDELMIIGFWNCIQPLKKSTVEVWSSDSPVLNWFPKTFEYIPWRDDSTCERAVLSSQAALLVGDTPVTADLGLGWPLQALKKRLVFCHSNDIPVHAIGVGVDQLTFPEAIEIFEEAYLPIKTWTVRSPRCRDALLKLGVSEHNIDVAADLAWLYRPIEECRDWGEQKWKGLGIDFEKPIIGVNVVNEVWGDMQSAKETLAAGLDILSKELEAQIVFFCNETRDGDFFDAAAAKQMMSLMKERSIRLPNAYYHPDQMIGLLSHMDIVISQRYHFTIESILAGTVPVSFKRGQKMATLLEDISMQPVGTMTNIDLDYFISTAVDCFRRREYWLNHLETRRRQLEMRSYRNRNFIVDINKGCHA